MELFLPALFIVASLIMHILNLRAEKVRYREFVKSMLSENIDVYKDAIEPMGELPEDEESNFVELDNVDEEVLIKSLKNELKR